LQWLHIIVDGFLIFICLGGGLVLGDGGFCSYWRQGDGGFCSTFLIFICLGVGLVLIDGGFC
jgi:hypothetical protein